MKIKEQIINLDGTTEVLVRELTEEELSSMELSRQADIKQERINEIQQRLNDLSQDFVQADLGAIFEDLDQRKEEFRTLHNEMRILLDKEPRNYRSETTNEGENNV